MPQGPPAQPGYDPNVQAGYTPPPVHPGQQFAAQGHPQGHQYPAPVQPQYGPPMGYPVGPQQGYAQQMPYQQPQAPQPAVDISQYIDNGLKAQGAFWSFTKKPFGTQYTGLVARDLTVSDIQQSEYQGQKQWNQDNSPRLRLVIPLVQPDGTEAQWDVKQGEFKSLATAINAAGVTENLSTIREIVAHIKGGDAVRVTYTHDRPNKQGQDTKVKAIDYTRGNGVAPTPVPTIAQHPGQVAQPVQQAMFHPGEVSQVPSAPVQPQYQAPAAQPAPAQAQFPQQPPAQAPAAPDQAAQAAWLATLPPEEQTRIRAMLGQGA